MTEEPMDHPEHVNPLGEQHPRPVDERRTIGVLTFCLVIGLVLIPFIAVIGQYPTVNVFVGLLPLFVTLILDIMATSAHYKKVVYWGILIVVHVLSLGVLFFINFLLFWPVNVAGAVAFSLVLGIVATILAWFSSGRTHEEKKVVEHVIEFNPEKLKEYVQSIEDKAKGINFAIGRVYRSSNGGTATMRDRLKINREWYNEFYDIKEEDLEEGDKEKIERAKVLLHKIHDRLKVLARRENDVFHKDEISRLKNLARNGAGEDAVIDVLKTNDRDPVENYYVSAVDFCERILKELD